MNIDDLLLAALKAGVRKPRKCSLKTKKKLSKIAKNQFKNGRAPSVSTIITQKVNYGICGIKYNTKNDPLRYKLPSAMSGFNTVTS